MGKLLGFRRIIFATIFGLLVVSGCNKKDEGAAPGATTKEGVVDSLQKSVLTSVPTSSLGFLNFDLESEGYKNYLKSSVSQVSSNLLNTQNLPKEFTIIEELKKAGLDVSNPSSISETLSSFAIFIAPGTTSKGVTFGLVSKIKIATTVEKSMLALKQALSVNPEAKVTDETFSNAKGFHALVTPQAEDGAEKKPLDIYIGWNATHAVLSSDKGVTGDILAGKSANKLPEVTSSDEFKKSFTETPDAKTVYLLGYLDIQKALTLVDSEEAKADLSKFPLTSISTYGFQSDANQGVVQIGYDAAKMKFEIPMSPTDTGISKLPNKPMLTLSIDGGLINSIVQANAGEQASAGPQAMFASAAKNLKRIIVTASAATPGKSIIPIPDIMLLIESANPQETVSILNQVGGMAAGVSGMAGPGGWTKKKLGSIEVDAIESPMGVGLYMTAKGNSVILSSTAQQLSDYLAGTGKAVFAGRTAKSLEGQSVAHIMIDFPQVADFLNGVKDIAAMYVPSQNSSEMMSKEQMDALKKVGTLVLSVKNQPGRLVVESFYDTPTK